MMSLDLAVTTSQADSLSRPTRVYPSWAFQICRSRIYPTSMGEGWGEGLRSLVRAEALTRFAAQIDLSPPGRGEPTSPQVEPIKSHRSRFSQRAFSTLPADH